MQPYLQRYEALQQERLRNRQARASDGLFASPASAAASSGGFERALAPRGDGTAHVASTAARAEGGDDDDDPFAFGAAPADAAALAQSASAQSVASDEFVDAATYLEENQIGGDDSFALEVAQQQWEADESRPSDFFERRSRNLEHVEFALESEKRNPSAEDAESESELEAADDRREAALAANTRQYASLASSDTNTALSSGFEVHFDCTRQAFTPNSLKYLQEKNRAGSRNPTALPEEDSTELATSPIHTNAARNGTKRPDDQRLAMLDSEESEDELPESVRVMQRGPGVIVDALHEIDALIATPRSVPSGTRRDHRTPATVHDIVREYDLSLETGLPLSRTTDSWGDDPEDDHREEPVSSSSPRTADPLSNNRGDGFRPSCRSEHATQVGAIRESRFSSVSTNINQLQQINEECDTSVSSAHTGETLLYSSRARQHAREAPGSADMEVRGLSGVGGTTQQPAGFESNQADEATPPKTTGVRDETLHGAPVSDSSDEEFFDMLSSPTKPQRWNEDAYAARRQSLTAQKSSARTPGKQNDTLPCEPFSEDIETSSNAPTHDVSARRILSRPKEEKIEGLAINPSQLSRRCRRLLCTVGETMTERIVFSNGSEAVGRISVSLLPLSTGCQQFSVSPAVLELRPKASSAFYVTLKARTAGVAAGIFQFRGVGAKALFSPYEVLIEASVRRNLALEEFNGALGKALRGGTPPIRDRQVEELRRSKCINEVEVGPTFVKFERVKVTNGVQMPRSSTLKITNNSDEAQPFKISCSHEYLKITPNSGVIPPASEATVTMLPLAQPFERRNGESFASGRSGPIPASWTGSFTVVVGEKISREVSFVIAREVLETLPLADSIARSRHRISSQTDAFYYTKRRNRRGLYFHARAVECGSCNVGESHQVPVYICNGSSAPMTVFLQDLMDPFSCLYTTTTIEPRKFIEVPVTFTPKVAGKVATSLFAYSVTDKAVVTLVARGI